jgi:hypothetical protein
MFRKFFDPQAGETSGGPKYEFLGPITLDEIHQPIPTPEATEEVVETPSEAAPAAVEEKVETPTTQPEVTVEGVCQKPRIPQRSTFTFRNRRRCCCPIKAISTR